MLASHMQVLNEHFIVWTQPNSGVKGGYRKYMVSMVLSARMPYCYLFVVYTRFEISFRVHILSLLVGGVRGSQISFSLIKINLPEFYWLHTLIFELASC